ncbi:MAG: nucleotide exchange factor GrpE [Candidatus Lloydbacteria bacterium RIFCSPHIGHO2_02_FULL_54_17]|uniref:Protein GrpE n=1 Tax=Candidatus Lloydbacteria bacterium RIFCSPHIGHO2_02_FULL_54_17 TaxID=1798664 RepID=A0A1G2DAI2_9BACT|nr:MAG: nucleotide exchange factor GrpE [Candidatus Lloydbacteria bacterium RIFCSPHIGHO2_01_FULL_54_11]OGZ10637.1 MAG: nucleotide exchange factor GrpE [Candidatus Lloydbacteria bacterium RIFCSPHIGHO2_02_FULL_54_17]OGZ13672.1 MAG: nucleotide exchange factor GrpE [Candidatus Lloydbacteria bacterium RIFCSPLOWO2_01_FULL_54_18]OGZ16107.1 MAG: nucleotide exchange factor GrpE [Candidatus Lloydbacteria bacterium RIFCSPLOWO2_02_FULL_54_12]
MDKTDEQKKPKDRDIPEAGAAHKKADESVDDVVIESYNDDSGLGSGTTPEERIKRLREKLRTAEKEKAANLDGWQRAKADFINYKKREEENKGEFLKFAREELVNDLIPVLESFHMAFANKTAWAKVDESWRRGVEHIHAQLVQILGNHGVTPIDPAGAVFDPKEHTAIGTVETTDSGKYHKVAEVLQLGYRLNGKLIRSPRVKVYGAKSDATAETEKQ